MSTENPRKPEKDIERPVAATKDRRDYTPPAIIDEGEFDTVALACQPPRPVS